MKHDDIVARVGSYYGDKLRTFGTTPRGVDWNGVESQALRFTQLMRVADGSKRYSLIDFGCGYGALLGHLEGQGMEVDYVGYDISDEMVIAAQAQYPGRARFVSQLEDLDATDFAVCSGVFNVKLQTPTEAWEQYVFDTLDRLATLGTHGFAFNMLTSYSDADKMRSDLYYADPCVFFDRCKRRYGNNVALLHDYGLYEFTLIVRKRTP